MKKFFFGDWLRKQGLAGVQGDVRLTFTFVLMESKTAKINAPPILSIRRDPVFPPIEHFSMGQKMWILCAKWFCKYFLIKNRP